MSNETKQNEYIECSDRLICILILLSIVALTIGIAVGTYVAITWQPSGTIADKIAYEIDKLRNLMTMGDSHLKEDVANTFNGIATLLGAKPIAEVSYLPF